MAEQPSFLVVGDIVDSIRHEVRPEDWVKVKCGRREAYGCGESGQRIVDGLDLYKRPGPEDHHDCYPSIRVGASRDVLTLVGREIDEVVADIYGRDVQESADVVSVDDGRGVMVLRVSFVAQHKGSDFRTYCLVYDCSTAPAGALFLLPESPHGCLPVCPSAPLRVGEDKLSVVLMVARDATRYPALCLWSPLAATDIKVDNESETCAAAWTEKGNLSGADAMNMLRTDFHDIDGFAPSLAFSYKGCAVWGDLGKGVLYCRCGDLIAGTDDPVDFKSKLLPQKRRAAFDYDKPPFQFHRNMGCVGDSIWFVIIEPPPPEEEEERPGETVVKVWTLDSLSEEWKPRREFKMQTIWDLDGFREHKWLPKTVPRFPFFRQQDDGILYILLQEPFRPGEQYAHLLGIDLSSSCEAELRLSMSPRRLVTPWMNCPFVLDSGFFGPIPHHMTV